MIEEQAKDKICPLSFAVQEIRSGNGDGLREGGPWNCFGSRCMAWRMSAGSHPRGGYCGMAGNASDAP